MVDQGYLLGDDVAAFGGSDDCAHDYVGVLYHLALPEGDGRFTAQFGGFVLDNGQFDLDGG